MDLFGEKVKITQLGPYHGKTGRVVGMIPDSHHTRTSFKYEVRLDTFVNGGQPVVLVPKEYLEVIG